MNHGGAKTQLIWFQGPALCRKLTAILKVCV